MQRCNWFTRWGCGPFTILYHAQLLSTIGVLGGVGFEAFAARDSILFNADVAIIRVAREYTGSESSPELNWYA